jgi:uncharacterized membrane protein
MDIINDVFLMENKTLEQLIQKRDAYVHNLFWLSLKIAGFFAVPAVLFALLGKKIDSSFENDSSLYTIIFLCIAFVFSWTLTIISFKKINKKIKNIESEIQTERQKEN